MLSDHGPPERHCPVRRRLRHDRLQGAARRTGRFRRDQGRASSCWRSKWATFPTRPRRDCARAPRSCSASSSRPSPTRFSRGSFFAIEERAHDLGYDLLLAHTHNLPEREEVCIRRLLSRRVDGLFISPVYRMDPEARIYQELLARQTPTVLLGPPAPFCKTFVSVEIEELIASYTVTQHLLKLGHKRIAYLTGPPAAPWAQERFRRLSPRLARSQSGSGRPARLPGRQHD